MCMLDHFGHVLRSTNLHVKYLDHDADAFVNVQGLKDARYCCARDAEYSLELRLFGALPEVLWRTPLIY